jgi:hypothetical protein
MSGPGHDFRVEHPQASTALGLGIAGLLGGVLLVLPLAASPLAWRLGRRAVREIDASDGRLAGRGKARAGAVLGAVGSVVLGALAAVALVFAAIGVIGLSLA